MGSEMCIRDSVGLPGYLMGVKYFYEGDEDWPAGCPDTGKEAEEGCIGCGWYDVEAWRQSLNSRLGS